MSALESDGHRFEAGAGQLFCNLELKFQASSYKNKKSLPHKNLFATSKNLKYLQWMGLMFDGEMNRENICSW